MKRVGDVLSLLFDERFSLKAKSYSALFSCWEDIVEKNNIAAAAGHSRIKSLERGLVWIEVDHPGWKQILQTKESKILSDFRRRFPEMDISGISIVLCRHLEQAAETVTVVEKKAAEDMPETKLPAESPIISEKKEVCSGIGYNAIKNTALKASLMRLEKSIVEKESSRKKLQ